MNSDSVCTEGYTLYILHITVGALIIPGSRCGRNQTRGVISRFSTANGASFTWASGGHSAYLSLLLYSSYLSFPPSLHSSTLLLPIPPFHHFSYPSLHPSIPSHSSYLSILQNTSDLSVPPTGPSHSSYLSLPSLHHIPLTLPSIVPPHSSCLYFSHSSIPSTFPSLHSTTSLTSPSLHSTTVLLPLCFSLVLSHSP